ncbi:MAG: histidine kinase [Bacteroidota bacterium]
MTSGRTSILTSFLAGFGISLVVGFIFYLSGRILIQLEHWGENLFILACWSMLFGGVIYFWPQIQSQKLRLGKVGVLILLFFTTLMVAEAKRIPDHPLTMGMFLLTVGVTLWMLSPKPARDWQWGITAYYLLVMLLYVVFWDTDMQTLHHAPTIWMLMILPLPLSATGWALIQWKNVKSLRAAQLKSEMDLLQAQINPHFLFNTLNNLHALVVKQSPEAPEVVLSLSEMLRYTIYRGKDASVRLEEEIEYLHKLLALHLLRQHQEVDLQFEHTVDLQQEIAPLIFVVFVENAIKHGLGGQMNEAFIHIRFLQKDEHILFEIENSIPADKPLVQAGIGLKNVKKRLQLLYPDRHHLLIHSDQQRYKVSLQIDLI